MPRCYTKQTQDTGRVTTKRTGILYKKSIAIKESAIKQRGMRGPSTTLRDTHYNIVKNFEGLATVSMPRTSTSGALDEEVVFRVATFG